MKLKTLKIEIPDILYKVLNDFVIQRNKEVRTDLKLEDAVIAGTINSLHGTVREKLFDAYPHDVEFQEYIERVNKDLGDINKL